MLHFLQRYKERFLKQPDLSRSQQEAIFEECMNDLAELSRD